VRGERLVNYAALEALTLLRGLVKEKRERERSVYIDHYPLKINKCMRQKILLIYLNKTYFINLKINLSNIYLWIIEAKDE